MEKEKGRGWEKRKGERIGEEKGRGWEKREKEDERRERK